MTTAATLGRLRLMQLKRNTKQSFVNISLGLCNEYKTQEANTFFSAIKTTRTYL